MDDAVNLTAERNEVAQSDVLLSVENLVVSYRIGHTKTDAVRAVSFSVKPREVVAIVGESGSGKTTMANAVISMLPANASFASGSVTFAGLPIHRFSSRQMRKVRGKRIGVVPQDPMTSLNPTKRIAQQVAEPLQLHGMDEPGKLDAQVLDLLRQAGLPDPERVAASFPHELSGGMKQRVLIAIAFACGPELIIADEPTSALDVTVAKQVMDEFSRLVAERHSAMIIITHDLALALNRADRVLVMKKGVIVESGTSEQLQSAPKAAYTRELLENAPRLASRPNGAPVQAAVVTPVAAKPLLQARNLQKSFKVGHAELLAVNDVSFDIHQGRTLALVGESGSGKSTTARMVLRLETMTSGAIAFEGRQIGDLRGEDLRQMRRDMQVVYQSPYESLDPRLEVSQIIAEPLWAFGIGNRRDRKARAAGLLDMVGLPRSYLDRRAVELSGGQRQRVAIARALALKPKLVVCDEPVSALDVLVQAQILRLLKSLQQETGVAYLFISHDLSVVRDFADETLVMRNGSVVESGPTARLFDRPEHAYTQLLLQSAAEL